MRATLAGRWAILVIMGMLLAGQSRPSTQPSTPAPATQGAGAATQFFGLPAAGQRIVYILDHSGSMIDTFEFLQAEAGRAISALDEKQRLGVILFSATIEPLSKELQPATADTKGALIKKLSQYRAEGQNDDVLEPFESAFERAFAMKPDTIYFLDDGHFPDALLVSLRKLNADHKVTIHTLAFVNHDPLYEGALERLAKENGGQYKFVAEKDLKP